MLIECLVKRAGITSVPLAGINYIFQPILGAKKDELTTSVCDINTEAHLKYLLGDPEKGISGRPGFRVYDEERSQKELVESRKTNSPFKGFAVQKYLESGYLVTDLRKKDHVRYAGSDGNWTAQRTNLIPFQSEIQAYEWLKEEMTFEGQPEEIKEDVGIGVHEEEAPEPEPQAEPVNKEYVCKVCGKIFTIAVALAGHLRSHSKKE